MRSTERGEVIITELGSIGGLFHHLLVFLLSIVGTVLAFGPFLLFIVRWHSPPDKNLWWFVEIVGRLAHKATNIALLLLLQFTNADSSRPHILI